jgi:hypothetical protein
MVLRRIGVWSAARLYGGLCAVIGLIFGAIIALASMVGAGFAGMADSGSGGMPPMLGALFGIGAVIFLPIMYGVMGVVAGALTAAFYNLFAGMFGGIELDIQ